MGAGVAAAPSVSSWARPPPGTSCRKSLRRQKSRRGRVLLKHCSTAFRKHWGAGDTAVISADQGPTGSLEELQCSPFPSSPPSPPSKSQRPAPSTISIPFRNAGQENGSHRVPQISEANVTRAQKQCVMSLEGQSRVSRFPCIPPGTLTFLQHAAHCFPIPVLHPQTPPSFPHGVLGAPYLTGHEQ